MNGTPGYETHEVFNQPPPLADYNVFETDRGLAAALEREGAVWAHGELMRLGAVAGALETRDHARLAHAVPPLLRTHDAAGNRIDEVEFHPAWHALMAIGMAAGVHSLAWTDERPGAHVARAALAFVMNQAENGVCCPLAMTFAAVPALRRQPEIADLWVPRITGRDYDKRHIPTEAKTACTMGMAMTEKQGGSDVRANTTAAEPAGGAAGPGAEYLLTGHKWFCSAPMSDAFLTLAQAPGGLSCFLVPRFRPDGARNRFLIQRLKDKLGNRSNASAEIEYSGTWARMVGEEGRGVATILEMVQHTRLDAAVSAAAIMRQAVVLAIHHCDHRSAFQRRLADQPLMRAVLADLVLDSTAATMLVMRLAGAFDRAARGEGGQAALARLGAAVVKYWVCKRTPPAVFEALECHGGNGYVEESVIARLYREAPVNSVWEGSGNVICLDALRAIERGPESLEALRAEIGQAKGADRRFDAFVAATEKLLAYRGGPEGRARELTARLALALAGAQMLQHAPAALAEAFCATRLDPDSGIAAQAYGALPPDAALPEIISYGRADTG
jgi:putative acyl-CoA dehydrogenase